MNWMKGLHFHIHNQSKASQNGMKSRQIYLHFIFIICLVLPILALLPDVHKYIDAHFHNHCYGVNIYFCNNKDATENLRFSKHNRGISRRVRVLSSLLEGDDDIDIGSFINRASVFVDSSCDDGIRRLSKNTHKMSSWFRWLIYVDDNNISNVLSVLNSSRLEFDSDVTLLRNRDDNSLEFSRLSRMYYVTPFSLSANYSLQQYTQNEKLGQAIAWRGEEIDLGNFSFKAVTVFLTVQHKELGEWHLLLDNSIEPGIEELRRYFAHLAFYLLQMYNFTLNLTVMRDWGEHGDGTVTGAFGAVSQGIAEFGFTGARAETLSGISGMDFSVPIINSRFTFVLVQPKTFGSPSALVVPFKWSTWIAFLVLVSVLAVALRITVLSDRMQLHNDSWGGSIFLVLAGISQNGIPDAATKVSARTTYLVISISLFLTFLHYSAAVLNGLILPSPDPIQNIVQLIDSDTELCGLDVSYIRVELAKNDTYTNRVRDKLISQPYLSIEKGLERVRRGHFAFYALSTSIRNEIKARFTEEERCLITEIQMIRSFSVSFIWRKGSPFAEFLNKGLMKMRERGIYDRLSKYWLVQAPKCTTSLNFTPITFKGMALAYGVLTIGIVLSLSVVVFELMAAHRIKKKMLILPFIE